ncbi:GDSL-type esterase/lipase family protein [Nostoc sp. TCL26-01]|uniref:GDSL-type esterase/lipase family protein n=1 Tax=Nostoc sp. TCL26-01 TaxID=2576904 RepID=UPI0021189BE1|nr:GDSL-type esterase/lipase family protein [Nostoc sp. TCL26-01]
MSLLLNASILLNIIFLFLMIFFIHKKGGFIYLSQKINSLFNTKTSVSYSVFHEHKESQFAILAYSERDIIFLGDSITDEGEWAELFNNSNIKNRGISGDTTEGVLKRIDKLLEAKPQKIFLMIGINDLIFENKSTVDILKIYKSILTEFHHKTPKTKVFIQSVLPVNNQTHFLQDNNNIIKLNLGLKELAQEFQYEYIDIFSHLANHNNQLDSQYTLDGLHLNGQGYLAWKEVITRYVEK